MAEERTVSGFTQINTPLRNRQSLNTIENLTQIKQYYGLSYEVCDFLIFLIYTLLLSLFRVQSQHQSLPSGFLKFKTNTLRAQIPTSV